jgi:hypothetical protein
VIGLTLGDTMDGALTRRTTLAKYAEAPGAESWSLPSRMKWLAFRGEVESALQAGGEIWEWESTGFRDLAGVCGLAIVRNGVVVRDWELGRS